MASHHGETDLSHVYPNGNNNPWDIATGILALAPVHSHKLLDEVDFQS
jgi:hypothetical protein